MCPPGATGVEYLLAEKWRGYDVYQQTFNVGTWAQGKQVVLEFGQGIGPIDFYATLGGFALPFQYQQLLTSGNTMYIAVQQSSTVGMSVWMFGGSPAVNDGVDTLVTIRYRK